MAIDAKIRVKACFGAIITAFQAAQDALKEGDMGRMCRWMNMGMQGQQNLIQSLQMLQDQAQDPEIQKFLKESGN